LYSRKELYSLCPPKLNTECSRVAELLFRGRDPARQSVTVPTSATMDQSTGINRSQLQYFSTMLFGCNEAVTQTTLLNCRCRACINYQSHVSQDIHTFHSYLPSLHTTTLTTLLPCTLRACSTGQHDSYQCKQHSCEQVVQGTTRRSPIPRLCVVLGLHARCVTRSLCIQILTRLETVLARSTLCGLRLG